MSDTNSKLEQIEKKLTQLELQHRYTAKQNKWQNSLWNVAVESLAFFIVLSVTLAVLNVGEFLTKSLIPTLTFALVQPIVMIVKNWWQKN